ncbi:MAG: DUF2029 domain-containing protein [Candidatus Omnitrophica bacterium]|nr:DUF2029 domain-containing protein [Candidatus Omnitrophota bacterium]
MFDQSTRSLRSILDHTWVRGLCLVLILYPLLKFGFVQPWADGYVGFDFEIFYQAALDIREGKSPYSDTVFHGDSPPSPDEVAGVYVYPAFFARLLIPLTGLTPLLAKLVFVALTYGVVLGLLAPSPQSALEGMGSKGPFWLPVFIPLCFLFSWGPLIENLRFGQSNLLTLALFCIAWRISRSKSLAPRSRGLLAGVLLGMASMIKLTPFLILPFLVISLEWFALAGVAIGVILAVLLSGWHLTWEFFTQILPVVSTLESSSRGIDLGSILERRFPVPVSGWLVGLFYLAVLALFFRYRRRITLGELILLGAYLPTVFTGLWYHHYLLALLPIVVLLPRRIASLTESLSRDSLLRPLSLLVMLFLSLLMGFYYWPPVRKILEGGTGEPLFSALEIFVIGHVTVFLILTPQLIGPDERD